MLSIYNVRFDAFMLKSIVVLLNGRTIEIAGSEKQKFPKCLSTLIRVYEGEKIFDNVVQDEGLFE